MRRGIFNLDDLYSLLGFKEGELENESSLIHDKKIKKRAKELIETEIIRHGDLFTNIHPLIQYFGMNEVEAEILLFTILFALDEDFGSCFNIFKEVSNRTFFHILAITLDTPENKINYALDSNSLLHQTGLIKVVASTQFISCKLNYLSRFCSMLDSPQQNIESLFSDYMTPVLPVKLTPEYYRHIKKDYVRLSAYLTTVRDKKICGANVLIYGAPGTGKTQ